MERIEEYHTARMGLMEEVSEGRARGRPRLGWTEVVKVAFVSRGMTVAAARQCARQEGVESPGTYVDDRVRRGHFCLTIQCRGHFCLTIQCSFGTSLPVLWWLITWSAVGCRYIMQLE